MKIQIGRTEGSPSERATRGKGARAGAPRSSHAGFEPRPGRPDPVALLEQQAASRVPDLVPIRYGRMVVSPFTFFRGGALIMASDLATTPTSGLRVQLCGDAHLSNFGIFGTPERNLIFDINDFDETLPGPWEWDVKRLVASFAIAGRDRRFTRAERRAVMLATAGEYRTAMRDFARQRNLAVWYAQIKIEKLLAELESELGAREAAKTEAVIAKARTRDSIRAFRKLTHLVEGEPRIVSDPPLIVPLEDLLDEVALTDNPEAEVRAMLRQYRRTLASERRHLLEQYDIVHIARKVVGVGSVGTRAWIVLFMGRDGRDPLFLQVKEAQRSVLEQFLPASAYGNCGQRVVAGQRLMQSASDLFLGWKRVAVAEGVHRDYYVRQLHDWKGSVDVDTMSPGHMLDYGRLCGWTLARAHARSGDRIAIASYLGAGPAFDRAMVEFGVAYADQTERDHAALVDAVESGRIVATTGL